MPKVMLQRGLTNWALKKSLDDWTIKKEGIDSLSAEDILFFFVYFILLCLFYFILSFCV